MEQNENNASHFFGDDISIFDKSFGNYYEDSEKEKKDHFESALVSPLKTNAAAIAEVVSTDVTESTGMLLVSSLERNARTPLHSSGLFVEDISGLSGISDILLKSIKKMDNDELHKIVERIFEKEGCSYDHYNHITKMGFAGYAESYINYMGQNNKTKLDVYKVLYQIDEILGTKPEIQLWQCCYHAVNFNIIMFFENIEIDFKFEHSGCTIFRSLFNQCYSNSHLSTRRSAKRQANIRQQSLVNRIEEIFLKLTKFAEFDKYPEKMKSILEMTSKDGTALIIDATLYSSIRILDYLLENKIKLNNCNSQFLTASFSNVDITSRLIEFVNPKVIGFRGNSQLYNSNPTNFPGFLGMKAERYQNSIHVAVMDQNCKPECKPDCKSKMTAFYFKNGIYIDRNNAKKIGKGGFGDVYKGDWHGDDEAAFKFIKINMKGLYGLYAEDIGADLQKRLVEINEVPDDNNILKPLGHFRQQEQSRDRSTGSYVAENFEVIVSKKCRMDLEQFRNEEYPNLHDPNCDLLCFILRECSKSLKALEMACISHNDIKPSNYLTDWPQGQMPTTTNLKIYLTDFGMVDRSGGTPIYCSPEGLTSVIPGVSDMFSLGRVYTFLVMEDRSLFYSLMFFTIKNPSHLQFIRNLMTSIPIMNLIKKMTHIDHVKRISIRGLEQRLTNIEILTRASIASQSTTQNQTDLLNGLGNAEYNDHQVKQMMKESKYSFEKIDSETNTIDQLSATFRLNTQISHNIHDQGPSSLCWAFSGASMLRRSLKDFFDKHKDDTDLRLSRRQKRALEIWLDGNGFHSVLRQEITMNPIPKRIKKSETRAQRNLHEAHYIKECSERMKYSTALDGPGVFSLGQVQLFFKKMNLDLSNVIIKQDYFQLFNPRSNDYRRFYNFVTSTKLCPVIGTNASSHAMVVDNAIQHGTGWYFQCKNTYKSNPQALVGHIIPFSPELFPYDAIIISFDRC